MNQRTSKVPSLVGGPFCGQPCDYGGPTFQIIDSLRGKVHYYQRSAEGQHFYFVESKPYKKEQPQ